jgi:hypothetical protein
LVIGGLMALAVLDDSPWDAETVVGCLSFTIGGLVLGIVSLANRKPDKGIAIAGVVVSGVATVMLLGLLAAQRAGG